MCFYSFIRLFVGWFCAQHPGLAYKGPLVQCLSTTSSVTSEGKTWTHGYPEFPSQSPHLPSLCAALHAEIPAHVSSLFYTSALYSRSVSLSDTSDTQN